MTFTVKIGRTTFQSASFSCAPSEITVSPNRLKLLVPGRDVGAVSAQYFVMR